jgi:hypothetical protein
LILLTLPDGWLGAARRADDDPPDDDAENEPQHAEPEHGEVAACSGFL